MIDLDIIEMAFSFGNVKCEMEKDYLGKRTPNLITTVYRHGEKSGGLLLNIEQYPSDQKIIAEIWRYLQTGN